MTNRANLSKLHPAVYQSLLSLNRAATQAAAEAGIDERLIELIKVRASQINGCAFCLRMHVRDALKVEETIDRLSVLPGWRETSYFSDTEEAALELTEAMTLISDGQVPDEVYERVAKVLTSEQISVVGWLTTSINAFNRVAITSRYPVHP